MINRAFFILTIWLPINVWATSYVCPEVEDKYIHPAPIELYEVIPELDHEGKVDFTVKVVSAFQGMELQSLLLRRTQGQTITLGVQLQTIHDEHLRVAQVIAIPKSEVENYSFIAAYELSDKMCLQRVSRYTFTLAPNK